MQADVISDMTTNKGVFPFKIEDLKAWVIHRKDGTVMRMSLVKGDMPTYSGKVDTSYSNRDTSGVSKGTNTGSFSDITAKVTTGYSAWCEHKPITDKPEAVFLRGNGLGDLRLWVANSMGARATKDEFDYVIDCGDIFSQWQCENSGKELLSGNVELVRSLQEYSSEAKSGVQILKINWDDRKAPKLRPEFWPALNASIKGDVMTNCQGGHGRSGTTFVCLLMVNAPDYDALDAIIHLRAVHCPRSIESLEQHEYINKVATFLGRTANAKDAEAIQSYKDAFMASTKPTAIAMRKVLGWDK